MNLDGAPDSYSRLEPLLRPGANETVFLDEPHSFHVALGALNHRRLEPAVPSTRWENHLAQASIAGLAEGRFLEDERKAVAHLVAAAPADPEAFLAWFEELNQTGPGQFDPLFDFIAETATYDEMRWFIQQEVFGEAGFEDLVALTQIKMPERPKLELARNYWDEMGRGKPAGMHGPMLAHLAQEVSVTDTSPADVVWESLALANLLVGLAYNRRFAFHAIGALGAVELTAPSRAVRVAEGLERVGLSGKAAHYFRLHATVDVVHWKHWKSDVLVPLLASNPELTVPLAEGALMRLVAGARCFDRYRAHFRLPREPRPLT